MALSGALKAKKQQPEREMPMRNRLIAALTIPFAVLPASAQHVSGAWSYHFQNGVGEYLTGQWDAPTGGALNLSCRDDGMVAIMAQIKGSAPPPGSVLRLTTASRDGPEAFAFPTDRHGIAVISSADAKFATLWSQLRAKDIVSIRYADGQTSVQSLAGAQKLLPAKPCG